MPEQTPLMPTRPPVFLHGVSDICRSHKNGPLAERKVRRIDQASLIAAAAEELTAAFCEKAEMEFAERSMKEIRFVDLEPGIHGPGRVLC